MHTCLIRRKILALTKCMPHVLCLIRKEKHFSNLHGGEKKIEDKVEVEVEVEEDEETDEELKAKLEDKIWKQKQMKWNLYNKYCFDYNIAFINPLPFQRKNVLQFFKSFLK